MRRRPEDGTATAEAWLRDNGFATLPVDLHAIAAHLDIEVAPLEQDVPGVSGMLVRNGETYAILVGTFVKSEGFRRFSLAHELAHYLLPGHPQHLFSAGVGKHASYAGSFSKDRFEKEADFFAAGLLMPDALFRAELGLLNEGLSAVEAMAAKCKTSTTATAITYAKKTSVPAAVAVSTDGRIEYLFMSPSLAGLRGVRLPSRGSPVPQGVSKTLGERRSDVTAGCRASDSADLGLWIGGGRRLPCTEQALGLRSFGKVLTVLTTQCAHN